ncbi:MAG TPA: hypothetical protein VJP81_03570 [Candidatus Dormibacteraeota bacterium]|nr:hypothetical protein [Candidatus Dormibacteraeota bacterium]
MRIKFLAFAALLGVTACGSTGSQGAASSSRVSASGQPNAPLFAVVSGLPGGQLVNFYPLPATASVKIVDANGQVRATATFVPPPAPLIGPAAVLLQSPVRTAAGAAFYSDNAGAVHKLMPDGATSIVATFPLTSPQQELTYAVSPDGAHLIAIVVTLPPVHNPPPQSLGDPLYQVGGRWSVKVQTADSGGPTTTTFERDLGPTYPVPQLTEIVGWDNKGPLATLSTNLGAQQAPPSAHIFGKLIHIASDGTHLEAIGGADCAAADELPDGTVLCDSDWRSFSVRTSAGAILWQRSLPTDDYYFGLWLSPDGNAVAGRNAVFTASSVASPARHGQTASSQLVAVGWLNVNTVVAADQQSGQLSLYQASSMVKLRDLGISGVFAGLLTAS